MVITPHHLFSSTSTQSSWPSWSRSPCCSSSCSSSSSPSGPPSPPSSTRSRGSLASYLLLLHYLQAYMGQWTEKRFDFWRDSKICWKTYPSTCQAAHHMGNGRVGNGMCVVEREQDRASVMSSIRGSVTIWETFWTDQTKKNRERALCTIMSLIRGRVMMWKTFQTDKTPCKLFCGPDNREKRREHRIKPSLCDTTCVVHPCNRHNMRNNFVGSNNKEWRSSVCSGVRSVTIWKTFLTH